MVKKMKSSAEQATGKAAGVASGLMDSQLAGSVKESAQQIWLAGMGAFSKAQEEGTKVFEALVKEGMSLQKKTQGLAEDKISEVTGKMSAMAGTVTAKAGQNWDKLESIFEQRTAKAMNKLGVPTAKDVDALVKRVDELAAAVARLSKGGTAKAAPAKSSAKSATPAARLRRKAG
jgi:poly(hydroxyalkanoate) granule-associated protein